MTDQWTVRVGEDDVRVRLLPAVGCKQALELRANGCLPHVIRWHSKPLDDVDAAVLTTAREMLAARTP